MTEFDNQIRRQIKKQNTDISGLTDSEVDQIIRSKGAIARKDILEARKEKKAKAADRALSADEAIAALEIMESLQISYSAAKARLLNQLGEKKKSVDMDKIIRAAVFGAKQESEE